MKSRIMLVVLGCVLAACSDQSTPLAPDAAGSVSLSQGGAPTPISGDLAVDEFATVVCGFTVQSGFIGKQKVLAFPNGRTTILFPAYKQTWINASTGRTITRSLTGSFHINPLPNGDTEIVFTGNNAIGFINPDDATQNFLVLITGRFTQVIGPDGSLVQALEGNGRRIDVCSLLA
jgi:hypothetical protein